MKKNFECLKKCIDDNMFKNSVSEYTYTLFTNIIYFCLDSESFCKTNQTCSCFLARVALEKITSHILVYENKIKGVDEKILLSEKKGNKISGRLVENINRVKSEILNNNSTEIEFSKLDKVRENGNTAAHEGILDKNACLSLESVEALYEIMCWYCKRIMNVTCSNPFDKSRLPNNLEDAVSFSKEDLRDMFMDVANDIGLSFKEMENAYISFINCFSELKDQQDKLLEGQKSQYGIAIETKYEVEKLKLGQKETKKYIKIVSIFIIGIFSAFLIISLAFAVVPNAHLIVKLIIQEFSDKIWDGSKSEGFSSGDGTTENPYLINSGKELAYLAHVVNSGEQDYRNTYFKLVDDIYLNNVSDSKWELMEEIKVQGTDSMVLDPDIQLWEPIGNSKNSKFAGHFDGNGKTIRGLYILTGDEDIKNYCGLFGHASEESIIENLTVRASNIDVNGKYVGIICGKSEGLINNCVSRNAFVSGTKYTGGIVGEASILINVLSSALVSGRIIDDESSELFETVDIENYSYFGGIAGICDYIINSISLADIYSGGYYSGLLVGAIKKDAYNCVSAGGYMGSYIDDWELVQAMQQNYIFGMSDFYAFYSGDLSDLDNDKKIYRIAHEDCLDTYVNCNEELILKIQGFYPDIVFKKVSGSSKASTRFLYTFENHGYDVSKGMYNSLVKELDFQKNADEFIEELNNNCDDIPNSDILDILERYGEAGRNLELLQWHESSLYFRQKTPVLESVINDSYDLGSPRT